MVDKFLNSNLRDRDFRGKNLEQKCFSGSDIRGFNFSYSNLTNANFREVTAGLTQSWTISLVTFSFVLALSAGLISAYGGAVFGHLVMGDADELSMFGFLSGITLAIFLFIIIVRGLGTVRTLAEILAAGLIFVTLFIAVIAFSPEHESGLNIALGAEFTILGLVGIAAGILDMALAVAIAKEIFLPKIKILTSVIAFVGAILGAILGVREEGAFFIVGIVAIITIILGIYIGFQAISSNRKYWLIRWLTINIVAIGSTKFIGANLTDADFTQANLTHTDFRNSILTRTCWSQAKGLDFARREVSSSYEIVELSVNDSINPQAATLALQELKQKYADKFELLAIEGTEKNNLRLHTKITESDSSFQLSDELKHMYYRSQLLPDTTREKILLEEKDRYTYRLEKLLTKAIEKPTYYRNIEIGQGNYSESIEGDYIDKSRKVGISGNVSVDASGAGAFGLGDNYGKLANTINQLPNFDDEPNKQELKELLSQLQIAVLETELDEEDKEDTLEQIQAIASSLTNSQDGVVKKTAKRAMKMLRGNAASLPPSTAMVTICNQLPDLISKIF